VTTDSTADRSTATPTTPTTPDDGAPGYGDRVLGCLLGTMAGDAYGVLSMAGDDPTAALEDPAAVTVSEATQLTLYTVDGLVDALEWANDGVAADETACLWLAYLRWLRRQGEHLPAGAPEPPGRWLDRQDDLLPVHDADTDTVRALLSGEMGTRARPLNPLAEGPGALMRSAPFGLVPRIPASMVERLTVDGAALTHGSAAARGTAALFSTIVRSLAIEGLGLPEAVRAVRDEERRLAPDAAQPEGIAERDAAGSGTPTGGPTAAGTFEAALQASLEGASAPGSPRDQLAAALAHAAAAGRPDASPGVAASVAGAILGALHGTSALPPAYLDAPGMPAVVRTMAGTLLAATTGS
jgi:ADP-ribosylglycohydrolase